jgi:hypothetical protein
MRLAAIVGMCLLTFCAPGNSAAVAASAALQATQSQSNPSSQSATAASPSDQQEAADPANLPQPATATAPCPNNSPSSSTVQSDCKPVTKTRKHRKPIVAAQTPAQSGPTKTVVPNGGTDDHSVNLSPGVSPQQASREVDSTNKLLATSDANLKKLSGRPLNANQQDTVKQIKSYMDQAKKAASGGDLQRANNLAMKANLLSAELAGH